MNANKQIYGNNEGGAGYLNNASMDVKTVGKDTMSIHEQISSQLNQKVASGGGADETVAISHNNNN